MSHSSTPHGSYRSYIIGFGLSLLLTIGAFSIVMQQLMFGWMLVAFITAFAVAQLLVQLVFFLHVGRGAGARWNIIALLFMIMVVFIIVVGSLWIMRNLDYNMMPSHEMEEYMVEQNQKGF